MGYKEDAERIAYIRPEVYMLTLRGGHIFSSLSIMAEEAYLDELEEQGEL